MVRGQGQYRILICHFNLAYCGISREGFILQAIAFKSKKISKVEWRALLITKSI